MQFFRVIRPALAATTIASAIILGPAANSAVAEPNPCDSWVKQSVASGYGTLENLAFDGRGNLLLTEQSLVGGPGAVHRLGADGAKSTAVANVSSPGGIVVRDGTAYFNTGNSLSAGLTGSRDGAIQSLNLDTGAVSTVATGLQMPNGLAQLPNGDFVVSKDLGPGTLTLVSADGSRKTAFGPGLTSTNGLGMDRERGRLVVSTTLNPVSEIAAIDLDDPARAVTPAVIPGFGPLNSADDLTIGADGAAYVALNAVGSVARVDLDTGRSCIIADGLPLTSSVEFGSGPGWDSNALYAISFLGTITKLTPAR
jgi:sugar lactone lactonase YvrE